LSLRGAGAGLTADGDSEGSGTPSAEGGSAGSAVSGAAEASGNDEGNEGEPGAVCEAAPDGVVCLLAGTVWQPASNRAITVMEKYTRMNNT
jgi:hypothetical protein